MIDEHSERRIMEAIDKDLRQLNIAHYNIDYEDQIRALDSFELQYKNDRSFYKIVPNY